MELKIGDLVQCRDNHYNRGLEIVGKIGMVAELRRRDIRILFDVDKQSIWLAKAAVNRIILPPAENPQLLDRLTWLIRCVDATECELERSVEGYCQYTVVCSALALPQLEAVRDYMRPLLISIHVLPRGMSRVGLEVVFRPPDSERPIR
ncbi:MAG: hypothetical protein HY646_08635 [Acidobacteria bacterium]|nr:hypothetical protein [Acidobacteriota bacterium]